MENNTLLDILLDDYAYHHALKIAEQTDHIGKDTLFLLEMMVERRQMNSDYLFQHAEERENIELTYNVQLAENDLEEERLANYLMDLEAKLLTHDLIGFSRAVCPLVYRLFYRLLQQNIPELSTYIRNSHNQNYDSWKFAQMKKTANPYVKAYVSKRRDGRVNSQTMAELLSFCQLPKHIQTAIQSIRKFERALRNPLAHLIQAFDEEKLSAKTGFSSQEFLENLVLLAHYTGITYQTEVFYYDAINKLIRTSYQISLVLAQTKED